MNIPLTLTAGDRWTWTDSLSDYPATLWTLTYYFRGPTALAAAVGVASGADHAMTVAAATTVALKPGVYSWQARANLIATPTTIETVAKGSVTVEPNLANAAVDHRSFWQQIKDTLEPVILGKASSDILSGGIAGRSWSKMSAKEITDWYDLACLRAGKADGSVPTRTFIRFERA